MSRLKHFGGVAKWWKYDAGGEIHVAWCMAPQPQKLRCKLFPAHKYPALVAFKTPSLQPYFIMLNDQGVIVDIYIPKKCTATGKVIQPKDHAAVQLNIARVDERGVATGQFDTVVFSGKVRESGAADDAMNYHCIKNLKNMRDV